MFISAFLSILTCLSLVTIFISLAFSLPISYISVTASATALTASGTPPPTRDVLTTEAPGSFALTSSSVIVTPRSFLLMTTRRCSLFIFSMYSRTVSSLSSRSWLPSRTRMMRSADAIACAVRSMPIFSTLSSVSLSPAVSTRTIGTPPMETLSSTVSLVVPGTSVTMTRPSPRRAFMRELLPALGLPAMTTLTPSRAMRPMDAVSSRSSMSFRTHLSCETSSVPS